MLNEKVKYSDVNKHIFQLLTDEYSYLFSHGIFIGKKDLKTNEFWLTDYAKTQKALKYCASANWDLDSKLVFEKYGY